MIFISFGINQHLLKDELSFNRFFFFGNLVSLIFKYEKPIITKCCFFVDLISQLRHQHIQKTLNDIEFK